MISGPGRLGAHRGQDRLPEPSLAEPSRRDRPGRPARPRRGAAHGTWPPPAARLAGGRTDHRHQRLVNMQDVEVGGGLADLSAQVGAAAPGERPSRWPGSVGLGPRRPPIRKPSPTASGSRPDHGDRLPRWRPAVEPGREPVLHPPGPSQVVRADQTDLHRRLPSPSDRSRFDPVRRPVRLQEVPLLGCPADQLLEPAGDQPGHLRRLASPRAAPRAAPTPAVAVRGEIAGRRARAAPRCGAPGPQGRPAEWSLRRRTRS